MILEEETGEPKSEQKAFIERLEDSNRQESIIAKLDRSVLYTVIIIGLLFVQLIVVFILSATKKSQLATKNDIIQSANRDLSGPLAQVDQQVEAITKGFQKYNTDAKYDRALTSLWEDLKTKTIADTRIKVLSLDQNNGLKIDGEAKSFSDIAKLISSLNGSASIKNVSLANSNSSEKFKQFSLKATYQAPRKSVK